MKLYHKIIIGICILTSVITGISFYLLKESRVTKYKDLLKEKLNAHIYSINKNIRYILDATNSVSQLPETIDFCISGSGDYAAYKKIITPLMEKHEYISLSLFNPKTSLIFSTEKQPFIAEKQFIADTVRTTEITLRAQIGELYYDKISKSPVLLISVPIIKDRTLIGIITVEKKDKLFSATFDELKNIYNQPEELILGQISHNTLTIIDSNSSNTQPSDTIIPLHNISASPLAEASEGNSGDGVIYDYRHLKNVAAWSYIPSLNAGIIIKMAYSNVIAPIMWIQHLWIFLLSITLILFLLALLPHFFKHITIRSYVGVIGIASLCLLCFFTYHTISFFIASKKQTINDLSSRNKTIAQDLNEILYAAQLTGKSLSHALTTKVIHEKNINTQLLQTLNESPNIAQITIGYMPYTHAKNTRLYAPSAIRKNGNSTFVDISGNYDYTAASTSILKNDWYHTALEQQGMAWTKTQYLESSDSLGCTFSIPFYTDTTYTQIQGIVAVVVSYEAIKNIIDTINFNQLGYSMIIDSANQFVHYPDTEYITKNISLNSLQTIQKSADGQKIYKDIVEKKEITLSFKDNNNQKSWLFLNSLAFPAWKIISILHEKDIPIPYKRIYHGILLIIVFVIIIIIAYLFLATNIQLLTRSKIELFALGYSGILFVALAAIYYFHQKDIFGMQILSPVSTPVQLTQHLNDLKQTAQRNHMQEPIPLKTGILIDFIDITNKNYLIFSGKAWQEYPKDGPAPHTINLPQSVSHTATEILRTQYNYNTMIVWWNITAKIHQNLNYLKFPFNDNHITIVLSPDYIVHNSILVPDLARYIDLSKQAGASGNQKILPGITADARVPGFTFKNTLFSYKKEEASVQKTSEVLAFNIMLSKKVLAPLMIYFLPIIVIIISLFVVLWVNELLGRKIKKESWQPSLGTIGAYSGLLFSTIAIHREIREKFGSGTLLYIEYLLIFIYIAMFVCELISTASPLIIKIKNDEYSILNLGRILFWPILLTYWFIITFIIFYN